MARRRIKSRPGLFGTTYYYDENGTPIGKSRPGLMGGTRVYLDQKGRYVGKSRPGFLSKEVFTDTKYNHITSHEGFCGDVHYKNGVPVGHTKQGFFDSAYTVIEENAEVHNEDDLCFDVLGELDDDFVDMEEEDLSPPSSQHAILRNIQLFLLCLVLCAVVIFVITLMKTN